MNQLCNREQSAPSM